MTRRLGRVLPVAVAIIAAATLASATAAGRRFEAKDVVDTVGVASPLISPDGKRALVFVTHVDFANDKVNRDLDIVDLATKAHRTLTFERKGLAEAAWSPDGTRIAFIASSGDGDDAQEQLFVLPMDGGDARRVTDAPEGIEQFKWRPDGNAFAYVAEDAQPKKKGADRYRDAYVVGNEPITQRGVPHVAHLWTIDADGKHAHQLTRGITSVATGEAATSISWAADGSSILYVKTPNAILNDADRGVITVCDAKSGYERKLTTNAGYESDPVVSPDGKYVAYTHSNGDNQVNLTQAYVVPFAGGAKGNAISAPVDRAVHQIAWAPDARAVYLTVSDKTRQVVYRATYPQPHVVSHVLSSDMGSSASMSPDAPPVPLDLGDVNIASSLEGAIANDGTIVFAGSAPQQPPELYVKRGDAAAPERVSDYNAATKALDLASAETITFPTSNGMTGDGVLMKPPGFIAGKKYPLVLVIHGGPTSSSLLSFDRFGQMLAAHGWLVLEPNYRGSDNLGYAYQHAVLYDPEAGPGKDIMAAVDAVRAKGIVDDKKIAVSGWSYGGIMTAWMVTHYHIWRAGVSGASVNDWITDYATADDSDSDKALFHGSPFVAGNRAEWERASAITYAKDVTTPLLILSDVGDNRDPYATSAMFYRALLDNKKDVTFVAWPVDGHFPRDPVRTLDVYGHWADYIAAHFR